MKKRSKLEVIYDLLKVVKNHNNFIKPTPLLRFSNLSSQNFSNYVKELVEKGLLENKKDKMGKKYFCLSKKGFEYLEKYSLINNFIENFGLD